MGLGILLNLMLKCAHNHLGYKPFKNWMNTMDSPEKFKTLYTQKVESTFKQFMDSSKTSRCPGASNYNAFRTTIKAWLYQL